jgi:hypothetical protein
MLDGADRFLKIAVGLGILSAGVGVGYHYGIYIPEMEREKISREEQRIAKTQQAERDKQNRLIAQKQEAKSNYSSCISASEDVYDGEWIDNCKINGVNNKGKNCTLPSALADTLSKRMIERKNRCLEILKEEI